MKINFTNEEIECVNRVFYTVKSGGSKLKRVEDMIKLMAMKEVRLLDFYKHSGLFKKTEN